MKTRLIGTAIAVLLLGSLSGCATTGDASPPAGSSARHDHMRDAKQGYASSGTRRVEAVKPSHDHRDFK